MNSLHHPMQNGLYERLCTVEEVDCECDEFAWSLVGIPIKLRVANFGRPDEIIEYGYICNSYWNAAIQSIECTALLYDEDGNFIGRFKYPATSFEKVIGVKENESK